MTLPASSACSSARLTTRSLAGPDLGSDPFVGEQLEQQRVRRAPIEDVRGADARVDRLEARLELWPHPTLEAVELGAHPLGPRRADQAVLIRGIRQPAGDIGEEDQLVGTERTRDR